MQRRVVGPARALRHRGARPGAQGALLRPRVLRHGGRAALAAGVADGVPARGDPRSPGDFAEYEILDQSVIVVRTEDLGRAGVPQRLPAPGRPGRPGPWIAPRRVRLPVPRVVLRDRRREHQGDAGRGVLRAQPRAGRPRPHAGAVRGVGRLRVDQPRRRGAAAARGASSRSPPCSTPGRSSRSAPSGGTPAGSRSTGSWPRRPSSSSTTCCSRTPSSGSRAATPPATPPTSIPAPSSTPSCTTSGR